VSYQRWFGAILGLAAVWSAGGNPTMADKADDPLPLPQLAQEVAALQTLYDLRLTPPQLKRLQRLAEGTAARPAAAPGVRVSKELRRAMKNLHRALVEAKDPEKVEQVIDEVERLRDAEEPELHDDFEVTEEAEEKVAEALRLLTASQVAAFAGAYSDVIADPRELLREALDKVRGLPAEEWKEYREAVGEDVGRLVGGLDAERAQRVNDQVVQWQIVIRSLTDDEFKSQRDDLGKQIEELVGDIDPTEVLRHFLEHTLAELLSNPRLNAALEARLKHAQPDPAPGGADGRR
jgi:hypothetical protein